MKTFTRNIHRRAFLRAAIFLSAAIIASIACNLSQFPTPTPTPAPATIPAGWVCYTNATYGFEVCYPPDATISSSTPEHARISFPVAPGTNLSEKWMDVDAASGLATCVSPQAAGYAPGTTNDTHRTIAGLDFLVQSGSQGAAGNFYNWTGFSTQRANICVSLSGVVHTTDALNYPTPPPTVDPAAESAVFDQIAATFRWLDTTSTPAPAATATVPPGWLCYTNTTYAFEVCYPSDATLTGETSAHVRIHLTITAGTNLLEKWMDVDGSNVPPVCQSPQASGYDPSAIESAPRTIAGLDFLVQKAHEGAAGNLYEWIGFSTQRADVCASLTGVLHSTNPAIYTTPPVLFNKAAETAVFDQIAATFRWLDTTPTPATTATIPAGWLCYTNTTYAFEVCYPPDATLSDETPAHVRIHLTIAAGTNLLEKWMDVDGSSSPALCQSPQAAGYDPSVITTSHRTIAGLDFFLQSAGDSGAGNIYQWTGYSTQRGDVCASLTGVLHSGNPGNYSTPSPLFDQAAESGVFDQIVATFRWLAAPGVTQTATPTPASTYTPTPTASGLKFIDPWISAVRFYYHGPSCGPIQVQFQIGVSKPELVQSLGIFFQLKNKSNGQLSGWSQGYAMSPIGSGKYFFTMTLDDLPNFASMEIMEAWLQYQFVANDKDGTPILHSDVFANVTLAYCAVVIPSGK
jgi:hypothetical protein